MKSPAWLTVLFCLVPFAAANNIPAIMARDRRQNGIPITTDGASSTSTSSTAVPSIIIFDELSSMTVCGTGYIRWVVASEGDGTTMDLTVTNNGVPQGDQSTNTYTDASDTGDAHRVGQTPRAYEARDATPTTLGPGDGQLAPHGIVLKLATAINPYTLSFTWNPVDLPEGWYMAQAIFATTTANSNYFFIDNGTDVSCLSSSQTSTTTQTSTSASQTASNSSAPIIGAVTKVNKGAIAGGVIGGLAVLAAIVAAFLFLRYSSASSLHRRPKGGPSRRWGNLDSFDSSTDKAISNPSQARKVKARLYDGTSVGLGGIGFGLGDSHTRQGGGNAVSSPGHNQRHISKTESIGPILASSNVYRDSPAKVPGDSDDDIFSPFDEKYVRSDAGHSDEMASIPIAYESGVTPSPMGATTSHATKHSSFGSSNFSYAQSSNDRSRSNSDNARSPSPQTFPESAEYLSSETTLHSRRTSSPLLPSLQVNTTTTTFGGNPSSTQTQTGGSPQIPSATPTARKTPRKPVPTYNPNDPSLSSVSSSYVARSIDVPTDVRDSDLLSGGIPTIPELNHKGSQGSFKQPVHYLMPDLPPNQVN